MRSRLAVQESSIQSAHVTIIQIVFKNITEYLKRQADQWVGRRHFRRTYISNDLAVTGIILSLN